MNKNVFMILLLFVGLVAVHSVNGALADNLIFGYEMNETSGATAYDVLGINNGTYVEQYTVGNPPLVSNFTYSANLSDFLYYGAIHFGTDTMLTPIESSNSWTFNAWIRPSSDTPTYTDRTLLIQPITAGIPYPPYNPQGFSIAMNRESGIDDKIYPVLCQGDGNYGGNICYPVLDSCGLTLEQYTGVTRMLTLTWNGTNLTAYYDGAMCGSILFNISYKNNNGDLVIGRDDTQSFYGQLNSLMMWSDVKTTEQINELYNNGHGLAYPFIESEPIPCEENWLTNNTLCNGSVYVTQYFDNNSCGTFEDLPVDNGTLIPCSLCTESWIANNSVCNGSVYVIQYFDGNLCGTYYDLPVSNGSVVDCVSSVDYRGSGTTSSGASKSSVEIVVPQSVLPSTPTTATTIPSQSNVLVRIWTNIVSWFKGWWYG